MAGPKFLIMRFSSLGDILLTFPVYRNIKAAYPDSEITVLTKKQFSGIFSECSEVDRVVTLSAMPTTLFSLRKEYFDFLIDLHSNIRSFFFRIFLHAGRKVRYNKASLYRRIFVNFRIITPALQKHTVEKYLSALEPLGIPVRDTNLYLRDISQRMWKARGKTKTPGNVLIIQTAFLGDAMLTMPLIGEIRKRFPSARVSVLCRRETAQVFEKVSGIDEVIPDEKKTASFFHEFRRLLKKLKSGGFDVAIIPHRSLRSAALAFFSGIPLRVGFDSGPGAFLHTVAVPFPWLIHDVERNLSLLTPLSEIDTPAFPDLPSASAPAELAGLKIKIGVNPSSVWETKRWPRENFAALIKKLSALYGLKIILTGGKNEIEYNRAVEEMAGSENCLNLTGKTSLIDLINIVKVMDLFITNDSGPMHIAAAAGIPVIAIFGPTTKELGFFPYSANSSVIEENLRCRPCRLHGSMTCPRKHFLCMKLITVERVFKEAERKLKGKR